MKLILKQGIVAAVLVGICVLVMAATKSYGVWVISAVAVVLVFIGFLRKGEPSEQPGKAASESVGAAADENGQGEFRNRQGGEMP